MKVSYSMVSKYEQCPYLYRLRYIEHLKPAFDEKPTNALHLGTCLHEGIEHRSVEHATKLYKDKYSIWDENNEIEVLKLQTILPKAISTIPDGEYEYKLDLEEEFIGYIDLLVKVDDKTYDIYDFKYAKDAKRYESSPQVHLYKYYFEKMTGNTIRDIYYVVIPKCKDVISPDMPADKLREKIQKSYAQKEIEFVHVDYDMHKIYQFLAQKAALEQAKSFEKVYSSKCSWCQFRSFCISNGKDIHELDEESKKRFLPKDNLIQETSLF